jgi:molybdate transport system regulatory protein
MTIETQMEPIWLESDLRLAGILDNRIINLLNAIDKTGSINQAAKQVGLSYKGAWQIIERVNIVSPKTLVSTAVGGNKGGGSYLTDAGKSLISLFLHLQQQHQQFLKKLNADIANNPELVLLLQRLVVKTSANNQLFGKISALRIGAVNMEADVILKSGEKITTTLSCTASHELNLAIDLDAVLLINDSDITLINDSDIVNFFAKNRLRGTILSLHQNEINAKAILLLVGGETLSVSISDQDIEQLTLKVGSKIWAIFKTNTPILGINTLVKN